MNFVRTIAAFVFALAFVCQPATSSAFVPASPEARVGAFEDVQAAFVGGLGAASGEQHKGIGEAYDEIASGYRFAARGNRLLSQFTTTTVDDVVASAGRLRPGGQIAEGARAIAKKLGHAQSGGYTSAFAGVKPTQANAEAIIRSTLQNPARTFYGDTVIDVYNAAGQGVRFDRATNAFKGFLEAARATQ